MNSELFEQDTELLISDILRFFFFKSESVEQASWNRNLVWVQRVMSDLCDLQNTGMKSASPSDASKKQFREMRITKVDRVSQSQLEPEWLVSLFLLLLLLLVCWCVKENGHPHRLATKPRKRKGDQKRWFENLNVKHWESWLRVYNSVIPLPRKGDHEYFSAVRN